MHGNWIRAMVRGNGDYTLQAHRGSYKSSCLAVAIGLLMIICPDRNIIFICKKVLILMLVGVANIIDTHVVGSGAVLRGAVICFYLSNEGLSLLENAAYLGLPIPDKLREILAQLHERSKKEAEPTDKGEGDQDA